MKNLCVDQGKQILHFEEKIGAFVLFFMPTVMDHRCLQQYLDILLNLVKFNPAYLDPEVVCGLINFLSKICLHKKSEENVNICLQVKEIVFYFSYFFP